MENKEIKIDLKYKIPLTGTYWAGINTCPKCGFQPDTVTTEIIGFADSKWGTMTVCECPECFKKWYFHSRDLEKGQYYYFKLYIENGWQRHYKPAVIVPEVDSETKINDPRRK